MAFERGGLGRGRGRGDGGRGRGRGRGDGGRGGRGRGGDGGRGGRSGRGGRGRGGDGGRGRGNNDGSDDERDAFRMRSADELSRRPANMASAWDNPEVPSRHQKQKARKEARKDAKSKAKESRIAQQARWAEQNKARREEKAVSDATAKIAAKTAATAQPKAGAAQRKAAKKEEAPTKKAAPRERKAKVLAQPPAAVESPPAPVVDPVASTASAPAPVSKEPRRRWRATRQDEASPSVVSADGYEPLGGRSVPADLLLAVRRVCNKLTVPNVTVLSKEIVSLFASGQHPRVLVVAALCKCVSSNCLEYAGFTPIIAASYAGLIRTIQLEFGNDVIAPVIEHIAFALRAALTAEKEETAKNAGIFIGHLLLLHCFDHRLPMSLLRHLVERPSILAVQVALYTLRIAGDRLRSDCPTELNSLISLARATLERAKQDPSIPAVRFEVLVDLMKDLATGRGRKMQPAMDFVDPAATEAVIDSLCAHAKSFGNAKDKRAQRKVVASHHMLDVSYEQCLEAPKPPQWYVSAALRLARDANLPEGPLAQRLRGKRGREEEQEEEEEEEGEEDFSEEEGSMGFGWSDEGGEEDDIDWENEEIEDCFGSDVDGPVPYAARGDEAADEEELEEETDEEDEAAMELEAKRSRIAHERGVEKAAVGQRFNTELRRQIFAAVAVSQDDLDAFHRLMQEGLISRGADVAAVLLQCAVQQPKYNSFYAKLLQRLVSANKRFKGTLQFALWDRFKAVRTETPDVAGYVNLSCTITHLVREGVFALGLLRGLDLHEVGASRTTGLFLRILLLRVVCELDVKALADFFFGVGRSGLGADELDAATHGGGTQQQMRKAFAKFFAQYFVHEPEAKKWIPHLFDVVAYGLDIDVASLPSRIAVVRRALRDGI